MARLEVDVVILAAIITIVIVPEIIPRSNYRSSVHCFDRKQRVTVKTSPNPNDGRTMVNLLYALHDLSQYIATLTIASKSSGQAIVAATGLCQAIQQPLQKADSFSETKAIG
ncbi:hypothetical protein H6F87_06335 [Cyanobacteria bacterium FACHB-502]|nr:hypothetical protein [Cyanobacteria bacterium FACHB-502]